MSIITFCIQKESIGKRLDLFLNEKHIFKCRSEIKQFIQNGLIFVNKKQIIKSGYKLKIEDEIQLNYINFRKKDKILPQKLLIDILYEDNSIIIVNKACGMLIHPTSKKNTETLVNAILFYNPSIANVGEEYRPGIVHRLDKDTSGLIVIAKTNEAYLNLIKQFKNHIVEKIYYAFVFGTPSKNEGIIDLPVKRNSRDRRKMSINIDKGKMALTQWKIIKKYDSLSFLKIKIKTGRMHQIRVHLNSIGNSIVGDDKYGNSHRKIFSIKNYIIRNTLLSTNRLMLHSGYFSFIHPEKNKRIEFFSKLPYHIYKLQFFLDNYINYH